MSFENNPHRFRNSCVFCTCSQDFCHDGNSRGTSCRTDLCSSSARVECRFESCAYHERCACVLGLWCCSVWNALASCASGDHCENRQSTQTSRMGLRMSVSPCSKLYASVFTGLLFDTYGGNHGWVRQKRRQKSVRNTSRSSSFAVQPDARETL